MYRFKDARGLTHALEDMDALRLAIAEGRVGPGTPLCEDDGSWTLARLHPAFRQIVGDAPAASATSWWPPGALELARNWPVKVIVVLVVMMGLAAFNDLTGRGDPTPQERRAYQRALTLLSEGDTAAMAGLEKPPKARALRPTWATMMGTRDVLLHMKATQQRLGLGDEVPATWMSNDHVLRASRHPEIGTFWDGLLAFHRVYVDSAFPIMERAVIRYAAEAKVDPREMAAQLRVVKGAFETTVEVHRTALNVALTGRRIHDQLERFEGHLTIDYDGDILFPFDSWLEEFNGEVGRLGLLAARLDSLEQAQAERVRADLAMLTSP